MSLLPKMGETFDVPGGRGKHGQRIWTCRTPSAEAWVLAGVTAAVLARGHAVGVALAGLVHETPARRAELVRELLTAEAAATPEAREDRAREHLAALRRIWDAVLPESVVSVRDDAGSCPVSIVLTVAEEGEDADGTERVWSGNALLLDDYMAIWRALETRFGRGADRGERFRGRASSEPVAGGCDGETVRSDAV